ncbi:hypothetical protein [Streptomyces sp. KL116D]|uniref:hypothetical protein n=1 Tax=Streptomyces sp. KL116D TaxID=3045152 RepID=UPI0035563272
MLCALLGSNAGAARSNDEGKVLYRGPANHVGRSLEPGTRPIEYDMTGLEVERPGRLFGEDDPWLIRDDPSTRMTPAFAMSAPARRMPSGYIRSVGAVRPICDRRLICLLKWAWGEVNVVVCRMWSEGGCSHSCRWATGGAGSQEAATSAP